ncbi:hypothetical protein JHK85_023275 [Glycine max]|nr:hypothetical protein JHK85_023275 [Glycine max]
MLTGEVKQCLIEVLTELKEKRRRAWWMHFMALRPFPHMFDSSYPAFVAENLRKANLEAARPHVPQIVNDDEDDTDEDVDNDENMIVDDNSSNMNPETSTSVANTNSVNRTDNEPLPNVSGEADDEWVVVSNRKK